MLCPKCNRIMGEETKRKFICLFCGYRLKKPHCKKCHAILRYLIGEKTWWCDICKKEI